MRRSVFVVLWFVALMLSVAHAATYAANHVTADVPHDTTEYETAATTPEQQAGLQSEVQQAQARKNLLVMLHSFRYLRAPFVQVTRGRRNSQQQGELLVAKPNHLNLNIHTPQKQRIVTDGRFIWHVRYALKQAVRRTFSGEHHAFSLLAQSNQNEVLQHFSVYQHHANECVQVLDSAQASITELPADQSGCFVLQPKNAVKWETTSEPEYILLYFILQPSKNTQANAWQLQAMRFTTNIGSTTDIYLTTPLDYSPIANAGFEFTPPDDFDVITDQAQ